MDVDRELREAGTRWRDANDEPAALPVLTAGAHRGMTAATLGVVALLAGVVGVAAFQGTQHPAARLAVRTAAPSVPAATPDPFTLLDTSWISTEDGFALGAVPCDPAPATCLSLRRTADGGATWLARPTPGASPGLTGVRFASHDVGYLWGAGTLWTTNDAGDTWVEQPAADVRALEPGAGDVLRVVRACDGCAPVLQRAPAGSPDWVAVAELPGQLVALSRAGAVVAVASGPVVDDGVDRPERTLTVSRDGGQTFTTRSEPCETDPQPRERQLTTTSLSVDPAGDVAVLCRARADGAAFLVLSTDQGRTFGPVRSLPTSTVDGQLVLFDATHMSVGVFRKGTSQAVGTASVQSSDDAGGTYRQTALLQDVPEPAALGSDLLGGQDAATGRWTPGGTLLTTRDAGRTWARTGFGPA